MSSSLRFSRETLNNVLSAYRAGVFPMADRADDPGVFWVEPKMREVIPIETLHIPRRLVRTIRRFPYAVRINADFPGLIRTCAAIHHDKGGTWINETIIRIFIDLHRLGYAHSLELYDREDGTRVGGLYGLALGSVFCGESMVSLRRDVSKIALVHLCARLQIQGFGLLDAQFENPHLSQFGAYAIPQADYLKKLDILIDRPCVFDPETLAGEGVERAAVMDFIGVRSGP